jgi:leader peptidase (prepilin peptidase)/N-methyltransferase
MVLVYALAGLAVGSFLNVVIDRLPYGKSIVFPPSHCPVCGHQLALLDLIPVLSFVFLRGRCRYCGASIPWRLAVVELATGLLFALLWLHYGPGLPLILASLYTGFLIAIFGIDLEHRLVPNRLVYPAIALALLAAPLTPDRGVAELLGGGALGFGLFLLIALARPGGMGMGDVKLAAFIGLVVGLPQVLVALFVAIMLGGVVGVALLLTRLKTRQDPIPFGPFLVTGGLLAMLWGDALWRWYLSLGHVL